MCICVNGNAAPYPGLYGSTLLFGRAFIPVPNYECEYTESGTCLSMEVYDDWVCVYLLHKFITCVNPCVYETCTCVLGKVCLYSVGAP